MLLPYLEQGELYQRYDKSLNWSHPNNLPVTTQPLAIFVCTSSIDAQRKDGDPQPSWVPDLVGVTDYSPTTSVDQRLKNAGLVSDAGLGLLAKNNRPRMADCRDGLTNTIMYAESAGRPYLVRGSRKVSDTTTEARVNGGGWARPGSDFSVDGSSYDGSMLPGPCIFNCTNGDNVATSPFPYPYYGSEGTSEALSFHPTVANFVFGDGSVRPLNESIDIREFAKLVTRAGHGESVP